MGKRIRAQRKGKSNSVFKAHQNQRIGSPQYRHLDYAERHGYVRGVITAIRHDPGRGAPLAEVEFKDPYKYSKVTKLFIAPEGSYTGQYIYCGAKAQLATGNVLPIGQIPEGTVVCNLEEHPGDKGALGRATGCYATIIGHSDDGTTTRVRLPSGTRKTLSALCRATVGLIAGGGRTEKPILKAGRQFHKYRRLRKCWPKVRGVAMNPVDHPHGGGNQQHIGHPSTLSRYAPPGQKVGLVAARRSGLLRGGAQLKQMDEDLAAQQAKK
ncbi:unnamed protein product [Paramecium primaurelia]|uniref:60S ribosomal protein L8 n=2 Tax=Paramecium TaxID=5884 RepID=A0A8S1PR87_PARPR|nr:unnamed protein product [Paramecium primaurelia]CAD8112474.1 unnamed protein product [Paramecium primaurelia]CAD8201223.1 unnamed protein product [Paramecium pentaurelia]CAD8204546.1 unnamed protein product [Paramecium pentaurelia]